MVTLKKRKMVRTNIQKDIGPLFFPIGPGIIPYCRKQALEIIIMVAYPLFVL
jgi:hypothetical protein